MGARVRELLAEVRRRGIELEPSGDRILVRPASRLDDHLRAEIRRHKPELLRLLTDRRSPDPLARRIVEAGGIAVWEPRGRPLHVVKVARFEHGAPPAGLLAELRAAGWLVLIWPTPGERLRAGGARALDPALAADPAETTLRGEAEG